jgi:hypothetical protein
MLAVAVAGVCAGGINAVVGSGTPVTFPVLLAVGLPPPTATISNSIGGSAGTGVIGCRRELRGPAVVLVLLQAQVQRSARGWDDAFRPRSCGARSPRSASWRSVRW